MTTKKNKLLRLPWGAEHRCTALLVSLVVLLVIFFVADGSTRGGKLLMTVATTTVFIGGIASVSDSVRYGVIGFLLMLPPLVMGWITTALGWESSNVFLVPNLYSLPFYLFLLYVISSYVFRAGKVTQDRMQGAVCIYLLLGLLWANAYHVVHQLNPESFRFGLAGTDLFLGAFRELMYFSYVTLTTLGYGDTVPISSHARLLALLEAISGVIFIGVLIARLAGALNNEKKN